MSVLSNAGTSTGVTHHWVHPRDGVLRATTNASASVDFLPKTASFNAFYVALVLGNDTSADGIFMKVQDNDGTDLYDRVFFYRGVNGGGWFTGFPNVFDLAIKTPSGRMTCYVTNSGETANIDIDRDFDGIVDEHFEASGLASGGFTGGMQFGLGHRVQQPGLRQLDRLRRRPPQSPPFSTYCTAKVNSQGCTPAIAGTGAPSASATSGFTVDVAMVRNNKPGLFFYKVGGSQASATFQCGTLCVGPSGIRRTPAQSAGGSAAAGQRLQRGLLARHERVRRGPGRRQPRPGVARARRARALPGLGPRPGLRRPVQHDAVRRPRVHGRELGRSAWASWPEVESLRSLPDDTAGRAPSDARPAALRHALRHQPAHAGRERRAQAASTTRGLARSGRRCAPRSRRAAWRSSPRPRSPGTPTPCSARTRCSRSRPATRADGRARVVPSRMAHEERAGEVPHLVAVLEGLGFEREPLPGSRALRGHGRRPVAPGAAGSCGAASGRARRPSRGSALARTHDLPVVPLWLADHALYHLDTALALLSEDACLFVPSAFDERLARAHRAPDPPPRRGRRGGGAEPAGRQRVLCRRPPRLPAARRTAHLRAAARSRLRGRGAQPPACTATSPTPR